ncbi:MAG: hypothetical protein J6A79_13795 [Clostridia bacterium]|nr:hypothetical protein [Clostridia bacterium]
MNNDGNLGNNNNVNNSNNAVRPAFPDGPKLVPAKGGLCAGRKGIPFPFAGRFFALKNRAKQKPSEKHADGGPDAAQRGFRYAFGMQKPDSASPERHFGETYSEKEF